MMNKQSLLGEQVHFLYTLKFSSYSYLPSSFSFFSVLCKRFTYIIMCVCVWLIIYTHVLFAHAPSHKKMPSVLLYQYVPMVQGLFLNQEAIVFICRLAPSKVQLSFYLYPFQSWYYVLLYGCLNLNSVSHSCSINTLSHWAISPTQISRFVSSGHFI